jgi:hypothetical protein
LREERRLRVLENRVLWKIFGHKKGDVTGEWRRLHNGWINDQLPSPNIICGIKSRMRWAGDCSTYGVKERFIQGFGGET